MPSLVEFAELCNAVYFDHSSVTFAHDQRQQRTKNCQPDDKTSTWTRKGAAWSSLNFYAAHYTNADGQNVLAYRGTDDLADALIDDVAIAFGNTPPQTGFALEVAASLKKQVPNLMVTGHSLGGALAAICAAQYGIPAVTYNAPGVMDACLRFAPSSGLRSGLDAFLATVARCVAGTKVHNVRIDSDPVSSYFTTGLQTGSTTTLAARQCGFNLLCRHGIQTCVNAVRSRPEGYHPVVL